MSPQTAVAPAVRVRQLIAQQQPAPVAARPGWPLTFVVLVLAGCCVLLGFDFSGRGLWSTHEGRAAQHAQVMLDSGQWGLPRLFWGEPDLQKPPLYYWLVAGTAMLRGGTVDEVAVRLPSLVAAMLLVGLVYSLGAKWWGRSTGVLAAVILTTMPRFWWLARVGRIDMPLACCVAAAMACFWMALERSRGLPAVYRRGPQSWSLAGFALLGVGVLLKGPIALVLPAVALACYALKRYRFRGLTWRARAAVVWHRLTRLAQRLQVGLGLVVVLVIAAPWFVWAGFETHGELWSKFFVYHNWQRALGGAEALEGRPIWYYPGPLLLDTYPWSVFAALALGGVVFAAGKRRRSVSRPVRFCVCWALAMLVLFSLVRFKRQDYLLPLYPALALLAAHFLVHGGGPAMSRTSVKLARFAMLASATVALAATAAALAGVMHSSPEQLLRYLPAGQPLRVVDAVMSRLRIAPVAAYLLGAATAAAAATCLVCAWRRRAVAAAVAAALVMAVAELLAAGVLLPAMDSLYNPRPFAAKIRQFVPPGQEIVYHRMECHDLVFYAGPPARVVVPTKGLRALLESPEPVYVVLRLRCREHCEGKCIGGCLRRRREEWPDLNLTLLATNRGLGDGDEQLALITNQPRKLVAPHMALPSAVSSR